MSRPEEMGGTPTDCSMCGGGGVLYDLDQARSCECRIKLRVRNYLGKYPPLQGVVASRTMLIHADRRLSPRQGCHLVWAHRPSALAALAGWMAVHARCGVYPRVWIASEDEMRAVYHGSATDRGSLYDEVTKHDLIVIFTGRSANASTASALCEVLSTAITASTPIPVWVVIPPGRKLLDHPALRDPKMGEVLRNTLKDLIKGPPPFGKAILDTVAADTDGGDL